MAGTETYNHIAVKQLPPLELDVVDWRAPRGATTLDVNPSEAMISHGNVWRGGWRREDSGVRMDLAAHFGIRTCLLKNIVVTTVTQNYSDAKSIYAALAFGWLRSTRPALWPVNSPFSTMIFPLQMVAK